MSRPRLEACLGTATLECEAGSCVRFAHLAIPVVSHYTFETLLVAFLLLWLAICLEAFEFCQLDLVVVIPRHASLAEQ